MTDETKPGDTTSLTPFVSASQLAKDTSFDLASINDAYLTQAGLYAYYAEQAMNAQKQADRVKLSLEVLEAKLDRKFRDAAVADGKKITEKQIENQIRLTTDWVRASARYSEARAIAVLAREALEALKQRRDMLIQAGKAQLEERKGELRVHGSPSAGSLNERMHSALARNQA